MKLCYKIFNHYLQSNISFSGISAIHNQYFDISFQVFQRKETPSGAYQWIQHWYALDGTIFCSCGRDESDYILQFPRLANFIISKPQKSILCYTDRFISEDTIRHLLFDQVLPRFLSAFGYLTLHASAIHTPHGAVAFIGDSGAGKSTLAASLQHQGYPVLTDDCLLISKKGGNWTCIPSYAGLRLWSDTISELYEREPNSLPMAHYNDHKHLVFDDDRNLFYSSPAALRGIYILTINDSTRLTPVSKQDAFMSLVQQSFHLDPSDDDVLKMKFSNLAHLCDAIPFWRLHYPRSYSRFSDVQHTLLQHIATQPQPESLQPTLSLHA